VALAARRFDAPIVQAFCDALVSDRSWDLLMLDGLSCADPRVAAVVTELHARRLSIRADTRWTQAFLQHPGSFEALLDARSRQFRKHYRQNERSLEKLGAIQVDTFTGDSSAEGFQRFVEIDAASWKSTGGESLANAPAVLAYYKDLVSRLAPAGQAEVWTLSIGGVPAAAFICLCDQRVRYCLKTSYSQQFSGSTRISPSQVLLGRIIEHCADHDTRHVDFLGRLPFVDRWADREIEMTHLVLARPLYARLLQRLRSLARSLLARTEHQDPNQRTDR
jgi:CelD/BcsL family acetyltransferase involved in cellulose biosynthesis